MDIRFKVYTLDAAYAYKGKQRQKKEQSTILLTTRELQEEQVAAPNPEGRTQLLDFVDLMP